MDSSVTSGGPKGLVFSLFPLGHEPGAENENGGQRRGEKEPEPEMGVGSDRRRQLESKGGERE